jgi:putative ABC transport system ATP-binding protein
MTLSTIERVFLLQGAALFREVPIQELVGIAQLCQEVTFKNGERFITAGEPGECLYILATGEASIEMEGPGQIAVSKQGDVIGEMAIISNNPRSASCIAQTDITALQITYEDFWSLMEENPAVTSSVLKVIVKRLEDTLLQLRQASGKALTDSKGFSN